MEVNLALIVSLSIIVSLLRWLALLASVGLRLRKYIELRSNFVGSAIAHRGRSLISAIALFLQ